MLLGMWSGDDVDPLVSPSSDIKDRAELLQVILHVILKSTGDEATYMYMYVS